MNEYDDYLIHFGVKGMKWGVRKSEYKSADKSTRKKIREDYKKTDEYKKKVSTAKKVGAAIIGSVLVATGGYAISDMIARQTTGRGVIENIVRTAPAVIDPEYAKALRDEKDRNAVGSALKSGNFGDAAKAIGDSRVAEDIRNDNVGNPLDYFSDYNSKEVQLKGMEKLKKKYGW